MKLIMDIYRLFQARRMRKRDRALNNGKCPWCGNTKSGCADWCWGPKLHVYLGRAIRYLHRPSLVKLIFHMYKTELRWAGVEPWHRYD